MEFPKACYVILHISLGPTESQEASSDHLVARDDERFQLRDDIWIERLDEGTAKNIQQACEPAHYRINKSILDRHLYAFVMQVPDRQATRYEGLDILHSVVALSRLVNPTSTGDRYCAQVMHFGLEDSAVHAIEYRGMSMDITLGPNNRDWLTRQDGEELRTLMPWLSEGRKMLPRIHRAYWNHESAMRSYYLDLKWMFVVEGLDALINTGKNNEHHFVTRVKQIADELNIAATQSELRCAYKIRSKLVHTDQFLYGLDVILPRTEHDRLCEKLEFILRSTVRMALMDENFGMLFESATSVDQKWKV